MSNRKHVVSEVEPSQTCGERSRTIENRKWIVVVALGVVSCISAVAYTKADRTAILLSATVADTDNGRVGLAPPAGLRAVEPNEPAQDVAANPEALPSPEVRDTKYEIRDANVRAGEWQTVQMRVTGYCPCPKCCGQYSDGITANGHRIRPGETFVAADRRYPFGTEMVIPGYSNGRPVKVLDRGGAIRGNKLDAFFHSHQEALQWGVKYLDVQVRVN